VKAALVVAVLAVAATLVALLASMGGDGWDAKRAEELALRAQELDPQLGDVRTVLGVIHFSYRGDHRKGIAELEKGVALSPNSSHSAVLLASFLTCCGRAEEALPLVQRALRLNPFPQDWYLNVLGGAYLWTGQFDRAIEVYVKLIADDPDNGALQKRLDALEALEPGSEGARAELNVQAGLGALMAKDERRTVPIESLAPDGNAG